ncbi:Fatty acid hydroxylase superfamily [Musa troglodytarum]|uniref:Fatty acid hydroxylase superfamily n=1 Tax=Musa troglodytarum TaxID=320322 RepID=A0A9E7ERN0_9LILI|nr:Fatty acid hydroxylase superfamily [Musa troglodytarum]
MLPFASISEAEAALGRNLTAAETVWFRYSAGMHDFWLYAHNIVFLLLVYTLAPLPVALVELRRPRAIHRYKLQPKIHVPVADVLRCYRNVVKTFVFAVGPLQLFSFPISKVRVVLHAPRFNFLHAYDFPRTPSKYIPFYGGAEYHDNHHYVGGQSHNNFASVFTSRDYIYGTDKVIWHHLFIIYTCTFNMQTSGVLICLLLDNCRDTDITKNSL